MTEGPTLSAVHALGDEGEVGLDELLDERYLLDTFLEHSPDAVYFKDTESRFLRVSSALARELGLSDAIEAIGKCDFDFFTEAHAYKALVDERELMRTGTPLVSIEEHETWLDGRERWVSTTKVPLVDRQGRVIGLFGISRDLTERKLAERALAEQAEELARLSLHDDLTGLLNRRGFLTLAEPELERAHRNGLGTSVLFIDLDGLKEINDVLGHRQGDRALVETAGVLKSMVRKSDLVARIGGDEFCVLPLAQPSEATAAIVARLEHELDVLNARPDRLYHLSLSTGCGSSFAGDPCSMEELIDLADQAMYRAKVGKR